jgi:hypothetical protein
MNFTITKYFPSYGWLGLALILIFWILNWSLTGLRTHWGFFPLWLGYSLFIDAMVYYSKGTSLFYRNKKLFVELFLISAPVWWLFELYNSVTQNWFYDGKQFFTDLEYFFLCSISFSTVIPAIFGTAELAGTFKWIRNVKMSLKLYPKGKTILVLFISGIVILIFIILFPKVFYPLVWISVFLLIEPVNILLKHESIFNFTSKGEWRHVIALSIGCLICGFFWEMWNYYSYPKWIYSLPMVNVLHIFEMPLAGYIGYLFFPFELFAVFNFITGIFRIKDAKDYLQFIP